MGTASPDQPASTDTPASYGRIAVLGGGAWGTALAAIARRAGRAVSLWARRAEIAAEIARERTNAAYLPGIALPEGIAATDRLARALGGAEIVLVATPAAALRDTAEALAADLAPGTPVILCAKGIDPASGKLFSRLVAERLPGHAIGVLSGPTFAHEAARGLPTAATIACPMPDPAGAGHSPAARLAVSLGSDGFRPYISDDVVGVETAGAVKNVIAIACGMMAGAGFAENTRAVLITRGLAEMTRLAEALGGRRETLSGLAGVGDLTLTCGSTTSRNMSLGGQLGQGRPRAACFDGRPVVVEGEATALAVTDLARRLGVEMPICDAVRAILHDGAPLGETFAALWSRPLRAETPALDLRFDHPGGRRQDG